MKLKLQLLLWVLCLSTQNKRSAATEGRRWKSSNLKLNRTKMNFKSLIAELCISAGGRDVQDLTVWNQQFGSFKSEFFICSVLVSGWIQTDRVLTFLFWCEWIKPVKVKLQLNSGLPPTLPLDWCRREETVTCWFFWSSCWFSFWKGEAVREVKSSASLLLDDMLRFYTK